MVENQPVRVRFAPSPTGRTHLGSGRTALYNYLLARQTGGQFILRIEDTDQKRYVPGAEEELMQTLHWLGLEWDEGPDIGGPYEPYRRSERKNIYREHAEWLIQHDRAYYCFCSPARLEQVRQEQIKIKVTPHYDGLCRGLSLDEAVKRAVNGESYVIRFKMPAEGAITVCDLLRGEITVENRNLDDSVLVKSDGLALYHLAAMVDDHLMKISHVVRGSEWLSSLPLHIHLLNAFGWNSPEFVHLSVFLKPSGKGKMSKREDADAIKDGHSIFLGDLHELGYLPEGVRNWIALMGWSYDDHTEFFTLQDLVDKFSLNKLNPSPSAINFAKLDYFNGLHIRQLEPIDLSQRLKPYLSQAGYSVDDDMMDKITPIIQERLVTLDDVKDLAGFFFEDSVHPDPQDLIGVKMSALELKHALEQAYDILISLPDFLKEIAEPKLRELAEELGLSAGQLFGIIRAAVTGRKVSPPLFESMEIIGRNEVLDRLRKAIKSLANI